MIMYILGPKKETFLLAPRRMITCRIPEIESMQEVLQVMRAVKGVLARSELSTVGLLPSTTATGHVEAKKFGKALRDSAAEGCTPALRNPIKSTPSSMS